MYQDFTATPIYNKPALRFPSSGVLAQVEIPMILTDYKAPIRTPKVQNITIVPRVDPPTNTAFKGQSIGAGVPEIGKINLTGFFQTPMVGAVGNQETPALSIQATDSVIYYMNYGDLVAAYMEGRVPGATDPLSAAPIWQRVDPIWFRDPYGRVFSNPRILDFTAAYVEAVPGRTTFTMILQI